MKAVRVTDPRIIKGMLKQMGSVVTEDGIDSDDCNLRDSDCWLLILGDEPIAIYQFIPRSSVMVEMHSNVIPRHRRKQRHSSARTAFEWLLRHTDYRKVIALIPVIHKHIRRFASEMGMIEEGRISRCYLKNTELVDQWIMGIDRERLEVIYGNV